MTNDPSLNYWPLVVAIEDCYNPDVAQYIIDAIAGLDDESAQVTITLAIQAARWNRSAILCN